MNAKSKKKMVLERKRAMRIHGICRDAETLGVDRVHLYRVLSGRRQSRSLLERYRALKAAQNGGAA